MRADAPSRLLDILKQFPLSSNNKQRLRDAWASVLGLEPEDTHGILVGIASVLMLMAEAKKKVREVIGDQNSELHLEAFNCIDAAFSGLSMNSGARDFVSQVQEAVSKLRFTVDLVVRHDAAGELDEALLTKLIEDVNAHLEALTSSNLPEEVRVVLHHRLVQVRDAAEGLRLRGIAHLASALDAAVGAAVRVNKDLAEPKQKQWYKGLVDIIHLGDKIIATTEKVQQLSGIGEKLLGSG